MTTINNNNQVTPNIIPPENEKRSLSSFNNKRRLLLILGLLFFVILFIGLTWLAVLKFFTETADRNVSLTPSILQKEVKLDEGNHAVLLKKGSIFLLPSGSKIVLGSFYFDGNKRSDTNNVLKLVKNLKTYHKGYIYTITDLNCTSESVWHDDYSTLELKECSLNLNITKGEPNIVRYNNFTKKFSSLVRRNDSYNPAILGSSPVINSLSEPFLTIVPPYVQLYRDSGLKGYTFTTPIGDTVRIYTYYGFTDFKFENLVDELFSKTSKSQKLGPLTLTLKVEGLGCYPPYLRNTGECSNPGDYPVYNKVDFTLDISQETATAEDIKILDYRW